LIEGDWTHIVRVRYGQQLLSSLIPNLVTPHTQPCDSSYPGLLTPASYMGLLTPASYLTPAFVVCCHTWMSDGCVEEWHIAVGQFPEPRNIADVNR